jgi:two-component SAPR family response regulator
MARFHLSLGEFDRCLAEFKEALSLAGGRGCEQAIAAELLHDREFHSRMSGSLSGNAVMELVTSRIDAMSAFRRLHSAVPDAEGQRYFRVVALGGSQMSLAGRDLRGMKRQAREILCYLVDKKTASKEALAEEFWPEHLPGRRAANTHSAIHAIRAALGKASVTLENGVYSLGGEIDIHYDVDEFERAAGVAERLAPGDPRRFFALTEAISQYVGPFLPDQTSQWTISRRRSLEVRYLDLVGNLASEALIRNQPQRALEYLRRGLAIDPLRDDFNLRYLEALDRLGQISLASQHYLQYAQLVRRELGIDPPEQIRDLYTKLIG